MLAALLLILAALGILYLTLSGLVVEHESFQNPVTAGRYRQYSLAYRKGGVDVHLGQWSWGSKDAAPAGSADYAPVASAEEEEEA